MRVDNLSALCAGTSNWDRVAAGTGSGGISAEDLMGVMGLISDKAYNFCSLLYFHNLQMSEVMACSALGDYDRAYLSDQPHLFDELKALHAVMFDCSKKVATRDKWQPRDVDTLKNLAACALSESLGHNHCRQCNGTAEALSRGLVTPCKSCGGTGKKKMSNRDYSAIVGINKNGVSWKNLWSCRYLALLNVCYEWNDELVRALRREGFDEAAGIAAGNGW